MNERTHVVEGYVLCTCEHEDQPHLVRDEVARRTGGVCPTAAASTRNQRAESVELVMRGRRITVPTKARSKKKARRPNPERDARRKQNERAKDAARKRLAAMFPDVFDMLVADERAARGLEPWPVDLAVRGNDPEVEVAFAAMFAELEQTGVKL